MLKPPSPRTSDELRDARPDPEHIKAASWRTGEAPSPPDSPSPDGPDPTVDWTSTGEPGKRSGFKLGDSKDAKPKDGKRIFEREPDIFARYAPKDPDLLFGCVPFLPQSVIDDLIPSEIPIQTPRNSHSPGSPAAEARIARRCLPKPWARPVPESQTPAGHRGSVQDYTLSAYLGQGSPATFDAEPKVTAGAIMKNSTVDEREPKSAFWRTDKANQKESGAGVNPTPRGSIDSEEELARQQAEAEDAGLTIINPLALAIEAPESPLSEPSGAFKRP
jgi:hypothetical protein